MYPKPTMTTDYIASPIILLSCLFHQTLDPEWNSVDSFCQVLTYNLEWTIENGH